MRMRAIRKKKRPEMFEKVRLIEMGAILARHKQDIGEILYGA